MAGGGKLIDGSKGLVYSQMVFIMGNGAVLMHGDAFYFASFASDGRWKPIAGFYLVAEGKYIVLVTLWRMSFLIH